MSLKMFLSSYLFEIPFRLALCLLRLSLFTIQLVVYQPQLYSTHVFVETNSKNNVSINLKLEHIVLYENSSDEFDIGHLPNKIKVTVGLQICSGFTKNKLLSSISQLWHKTASCD